MKMIIIDDRDDRDDDDGDDRQYHFSWYQKQLVKIVRALLVIFVSRWNSELGILSATLVRQVFLVADNTPQDCGNDDDYDYHGAKIRNMH